MIVVKKKNNFWIRALLILFVSFLFAINIRIFVKPAGLLPGGLSGVTLLIQQICVKFFEFEPSYTLINVLLNLFPIYIGFKFIGKKFTLLSCIVIVTSGFFVDLIPAFNVWTEEMLLYSVFGGIINGVLISFCLLLGGTSGGTDFISIYFSEQKGKDAWNYILMFNIVILLTAGLIFGFEIALYSIIFQYASTQAIKMLFTRYQKSTMLIITKEPNKVYKLIKDITNHSGTLFKGKGFYGDKDVNMVYSIVDADEVSLIVKELKKIDESAFVNILRTESIEGTFYKRPTE
ncbi:MAG: YitT family protein [Bacilli bacterium]|nr:YitT family protein [Bacilli bacterium]